MACQKCGSAWVTLKGKDMVSCPECCKQQRSKALRLGRLPSSQTKVCERCGAKFEAVGGNAIRRARCCSACKASARKDWLASYKSRVKSGEHVPLGKPLKDGAARKCQWCQCVLTTTNQRKYCSNKCFVDARNAGQQSWDRRRQLESVWHKGGRWANAPSKKIVAEMEGNFTKFVSDMNSFRLIREMQGFMYRSLFPRKSDDPCKICGKMIGDSSRTYCSVDCMKQDRVNASCVKCGLMTKASPVSTRVLCLDCRRDAKRIARRVRRQMRGGDHPSRARHHGVKCMRFPRKMIFERDGYVCQLCGEKTLLKVTYRKSDGKIHSRSPTVDCIVSMKNGGNYEPPNCQTACFMCNSKKGASNRGQLRLLLG